MFSFCAPTGVLALALSILPHTSASYLAPLPARTAVPHFPISQVYPLPTKAPSPPGALLARDDETSSIETALMAPDNVCGYISGRPGAEYGCAPSAQCVFFTAKTTQDGNLVCCNTDTCAGQITCMDYQQVVESSRCDDGCMVDTFTLKCTNSDSPYCNTVSFHSDIYGYWCNDADISTPQAAYTTYEGQSSTRKFTPLPLEDEETDPATGFDRPTQSSDPDGNEDGEGQEGEEERGGGGDDDDGGGGGGGKKKDNAGAIAGGVVGGVAVVGLIGLGIAFILRRKKNDAPPAAPATQQAPPGWTQPNSPQGGYAAGFFKSGQEIPNYAQAVEPQQPQQPQPQQQHQGLVPVPDRNSPASPRESTLVGSPTAYGYQQQFQQGVPAQGQQVPQGQQLFQGQQVPQPQDPPQGQQPAQGQAPQGHDGVFRHELGPS